MTEKEIFTRVSNNRKKIEELTDYTTFVLNPEIVRLEDEIEALQYICKHEYENQICKYCGKEKTE